jgi:hypothetical protein
MKKKSKAGRVPKDRIPLLVKRSTFIKILLKSGHKQVDIAWAFGLHPSQINRIARE